MNITNSEVNRMQNATTDNVPESICCVPQFEKFYDFYYTAEPHMGVEDLDPATGNNLTSQSQDVGEGTDAQQTTTFNSDGIVNKVSKVMFKSLPDLFYSSSDSNNSQDIKAFLAKPIVLAENSLSTADIRTTVKEVIRSPSGFFNTQVANKFAGYVGFRATVVVRIVVNANPFQQGRYMLVYVPLGGAIDNEAKTAAFINAHTNTLYETTQLPHVEFDVTCDTEVVLSIPFSSVLNYYPLHATVSSVGHWGRFILVPYSPLQAVSGPTTAGYTMYGHFENIELVGAAQPEMGTASEKERKSSGDGPVSSILLGISKVSSIVAEVPMLSSFASTVSWATDIAGRSAKAAGFSKPNNVSSANRVQPITGNYMGNVDGVDQGIYLAASSEAAVSILPGFAGTDVDEMDITHIATIPAWFDTVNWTVGAGRTILYTAQLRPGSFQKARTFSSLSVRNMTPLAFVSNMFSLWRGSLVFTLKFVKTIYHSGRIAVTFLPRSDDVPDSAYVTSYSSYLHREIIDIRNCNEVTFTVPFINHKPYLQRTSGFGQLIIEILDPLVAPATVPSSVPILMEVSGGPDIEFARPIGRNNPDGTGIQGTVFYGATPQMGDVCDLIDKSIGSTSIIASSTVNSELCIGEKVTSFRSLLKIAKVQTFNSPLSAGISNSICPHIVNAMYFDTTPTLTFGYATGDLYDLLGACYLFSRGGMSVKAVAGSVSVLYLETSTNAPSAYIGRGANDLFGNPWAISSINGGKYVITANSTANWIAEALVPQYSHTHSRNNIALAANPQTGYAPNSGINLGSDVIVVMGQGIGSTPTSVAQIWYRAVADDFSFGGFVSTVPTYYVSGSANL